MRLIDADALIAQMEADAEQMEDLIAKMFAYAVVNDVKHAPTIEERKKGKWLVEPYDVENDIWVHRCGECMKVTMLGSKKPRFDYCPNCGADMRGKS